MSRILYYLVLKPLSFLPLWILYRLSDLLYFFFRFIFTYRKEVVFGNIQRSFPKHTEKEHRAIMYGFYRHLCDLIVEGIRLFSIPKKEVLKRFKVINPSVMDKYFEQGKDVVLVGGHYNNWEMLSAGIDLQIKHKSTGIYAPLKNAFFNKAFLDSRGKYGTQLISKKETSDFFKADRDVPACIIFGADQSPTYSKHVIWTTFLNQDTAVAVGTEMLSKRHRCPVIYGAIEKVSRGHYTLTFTEICEDASKTKPEEITKAHTRMLENQIIQKPAYWLWSHKRWKRKRETV
jgi:KDO2-lipid IV(A) lauroyltransferase